MQNALGYAEYNCFNNFNACMLFIICTYKTMPFIIIQVSRYIMEFFFLVHQSHHYCLLREKKVTMVTLVIVDRYLHNITSVNFYRIEETFETVGKTLILAFLKLSDVQNRSEKKLLVITFYNQVRAPTYRVSEFCFEIFSEPIL